LLSHKTTAHKDDVMRHASKAGWSRIMWSVCLEKLSGSSSFWQPYFSAVIFVFCFTDIMLDILPEKFNLPISWSEEDKSRMEGTGVLEMIGDPEQDFRQTFAKTGAKMPACTALPVDTLRALYFYSGSLVSSYSFMEPDGTILMVPMADMLNHRTGHNNARLFFGRDELQMVCVKDVKTGEQLYNTYGDLGNAELLFKYGYMDEVNAFSKVELHVSEFMEFSGLHSCPVHKPADFKPSAFEKLIEKGSIPEFVHLSAEPRVSSSLLKWFKKAYKASDSDPIKGCVCAFLRFHESHLLSFVPCNANQRLAAELISEHRSILAKYIAFIENL